MRSKLGYLTGVSLKRKIKTKWFLIANLLLALVIVALINIDSIINFFGGDFNKVPTIYVVDNASSYEILKNQFDSTQETLGSISYNVVSADKSIDELKQIINEQKEEENNIILIINPSEINTIDVTMITKEYIDLVDTQVITSAINNTKVTLAIMSSSISQEELNNIYKTIEIERQWLDDEKTTEDENMNMMFTTIFPVVVLPIFMLTLFLVQMIGAEVNDEKTTRGMEIIISNVSPKTHFFSKVIAGNLFVIIQGILLILYLVLGIFIRNKIGVSDITGGLGSEVTIMFESLMTSDIGSKLIYIIPLALVLILTTFLAYSLLAGILASMTTNTEDFQQLQTPIIVISLIGYYLGIMSQIFEGAVFIKVLAFFPLISSVLAPSLLVLGQFSVFEMVISILITIVFILILIKYGLKVYKVGILNYSSKDLWKKMIKAIKN
ncbi:MAG: ABC transporter permease [Clostridium sp.]|nr:ABC transporter permease [Clostridium sp.]MCM1444330.1 ABC transporter permease [Candidatus Amulumruptor caecigallinarius]